jgi:hypothetical protein
MDYLGGNQVVLDLDSSSTHDNAGPFRMVVHNFSRYADTVETLPILERIKLVVIADFIVESFLPGNLPVMGVKLIGHADFDPQRERREPGFLQRISDKRATDVETELLNRVDRGTWVFNPRKNGFRPDRMRWLSWGVADREPAEENIRRGRTIANMTEEDRKLNRRVEIFLEPGPTPVPDNDLADKILDALKNWQRDHPPGDGPPPLPPWMWDPNFPGPGPRNRNEYNDFKCAMLDKLKSFDVDKAVDTLKDMFLKDPSQTNDWTNSVRQMIDEIDKRRREGLKEWWRDDDCPQPPGPLPVKRPRLIVEPRVVNITRGGDAKIKVTVQDRPYAGSIQIDLRVLPLKVTAPRRAIPSYQDFVEIPLDAAADAPVTTERSVFADATYPDKGSPVGGNLKSDLFTVNVQ